MEEIIVQILSVKYIKKNVDFILSKISEERINKANKYQQINDYYLSIGAALLLANNFKDQEIKIHRNGKPYIEGGPYFNIAHSRDYVIFAKSNNREIGVDIEIIRKEMKKAIHYVLKEEEKVDDLEELFSMWSAKESLTKCLSTGMYDMRKVPAQPVNGVRLFNDKKYYSQTMIYKKYSLSVTLEGEEPFFIKIVEVK